MVRARAFAAAILAACWIGGEALSAAEPALGPATLPPAVRVLRTAGVRTDAAALLFGAPDAGALRTAIAVFPTPSLDAIDVVVEIAGADLLAVAAPRTERAGDGALRRLESVEIAVYVLAADGALRASLASGLELDLDRAVLDTGGLRWAGRTKWPAGGGGGSHRVRALVRVGGANVPITEAAANGAVSITSLEFDLPPGGLAAWQGPPRLAGRAGGDGWLAVDTRPGGPGGSGGAEIPPARAQLTLGRAASIVLPTGASPAATLEARSVERLDAPLSWPAQRDAPAGDRTGALATFVPQGLPAGWAKLRWLGGAPGQSAAAAAAAGPTNPSLDVWIQPEDGAPAGTLAADNWTALPPPGDVGANAETDTARVAAGNDASGATNTALPPRKVTRLSRARIAEARRDWTAAHLLWTAGRETEAEDRLLAALERDLRGQGNHRPVDGEDLAGNFFLWLRELGEDARGGWLSVVALHDRVYTRSLANQHYLVATYSRRVAMTLAALLPREVPSTQGPMASYLTHFAARAMNEYGDIGIANAALDAALQLEPRLATARITRALELDRRGQSREAVDFLRPLLEGELAIPASASSTEGSIDGGHPGGVTRGEVELRLRLASARAGLDSDAETNRALERLSSEPGWIGALAAQERWRRAVSERRRDDEAVAAGLTAARARAPEDEKLALLAAWQARRQGGDAEQQLAEDITASIAASPGTVVGPRRRLGERLGEASPGHMGREIEPFVAAERASRPKLAEALRRMPRS